MFKHKKQTTVMYVVVRASEEGSWPGGWRKERRWPGLGVVHGEGVQGGLMNGLPPPPWSKSPILALNHQF
jgi:hypothetical protein